MTTNKPEVRVFRPSAQAGCPAMRIVFPSDRVSQDNKYVRLSDYETLQVERDRCKNTIAEVTSRHFAERWSKTTSDKELEQYLSDGITQLEDEHRKQIEALQAECEKLREHLQNLIDQTTPLEPVPGNPMWSRRIQLDEVMAERDSLRAECEKLRKDAKRYVPLNEAVQRAAAELPEVWEIHLCVARDSGSVDLIGPDGTEDFYTDNERLDYTVIDALEFAIDAAMQGDQP